MNSADAIRIIKLHGSFPSHRPLIITREDYRRRYQHSRSGRELQRMPGGISGWFDRSVQGDNETAGSVGKLENGMPRPG